MLQVPEGGRKMRRLHFVGALFALFILGAAYALSQVANATLLGTVTDSSGAVIANARVVATEQDTGTVRSTETNSSGNYVFADVVPGRQTRNGGGDAALWRTN